MGTGDRKKNFQRKKIAENCNFFAIKTLSLEKIRHIYKYIFKNSYKNFAIK